MRLPVLLLSVLALPLAGGLPVTVDGADVCEAAGGAALCSTAMAVGADAQLFYSQQVLSCETTTCTYRPTARISLATTAPGEWVLRATTYATHYPSNAYLAGSAKTLECRAIGPEASCSDARISRDVVGDSFNSAKWHGTWELYLVDALGEEHLQAAWSGSGWLAQYCRCG